MPSCSTVFPEVARFTSFECGWYFTSEIGVVLCYLFWLQVLYLCLPQFFVRVMPFRRTKENVKCRWLRALCYNDCADSHALLLCIWCTTVSTEWPYMSTRFAIRLLLAEYKTICTSFVLLFNIYMWPVHVNATSCQSRAAWKENSCLPVGLSLRAEDLLSAQETQV